MTRTALLLLTLLAGCGNAEPEPETPTRRYSIEMVHHHIYEFKLDDGTRCVSTTNGGLACEWRK